MILKTLRSEMAKVVLIDLDDFSHNEIEINLDNPLLPVATPLIAALAGQITDNNFVVISKGVLGGKNGVGLSDAIISAVSPQSGGLIESKIQGRLANALNSIGVDAIALTNKAKSLTGVEITDRGFLEFYFPKVKNLKGASVWKTIDKVKGSNTLTTLAISNFGEKQAIGASVVSDYGFATSQGGIGAVFGRMNIKYLTIAGVSQRSVSPGVKQITDKYIAGLESNPLTKSEHDAPGFGIWANKSLVGYMAGNNFGSNLPNVVDNFEPKSFLPYLKDDGTDSCPGCPQQCLKSYLVSDGPIDGGRQHQLSVTALLSQYGEGDVEKLIEFNTYCHEIGVEHIYMSALLIQESIKSKNSIAKMVNKVATKKLKSGSNQIKGMAIPPWDGRGNQGLFLAMALNPSGPRYDVIEHDIDFDPDWVWSRHVEFGTEYGIPKGGLPLGTLDKRRENSIIDLWLLWSALDALGICIYAAPPTRELESADILALIKTITGETLTMDNLFDLGLARLLIQRDMNHRLGVDHKTDTLPDIFFDKPIKSSGAKLDGAVIRRSDFNEMKSAIIKRLQWSEAGGVDKSSKIWQVCADSIAAVRSRIL
jgi:aldehyde:ferredoxin oxidoreductase